MTPDLIVRIFVNFFLVRRALARALAREKERPIKSNPQPQLSKKKSRISGLEIDVNSIRRSHGYPQVAFQELPSAKFEETAYSKEALSRCEELARLAAASPGAYEDEIEEEARATAVNEPNKEGAPADKPISPSTVHPSQVLADKAEEPKTKSTPEEFFEMLDKRELGDMLMLGGDSQSSLAIAVVSHSYGGEANSAWYELQAHHRVPNTGAATTPSESRNDEPSDEPIQVAISEPAHEGIHPAPAQAE